MTAKKIHSYFIFREKLHELNTSGLYTMSQVRKVAGMSSTLRRYLGDWQKLRLIEKNGKHLKLNTLSGRLARLHRLYMKHRNQIESAEKPAIYFADLYKRTVIYANVIAQVKKESERINNKALERKYQRHVTDSKTSVGVKQNIFLSMETIGRLLNRSKTTAWKYITRMDKEQIIRIVKHLQRICDLTQLTIDVKKAWNLYGRLTVKNGTVYERLQNGYFF